MPNSKIKQPEHVRTAISKLSFCSTQAKSEKGRGMECRGINGRIKLFFPLAPAGSCPYWGEGLTEKWASYSLICCLNPVLSSGCLYVLGLNNLPRHQRHEVPGMALRVWLMLYRGKVALKSRTEYLFQNCSHHWEPHLLSSNQVSCPGKNMYLIYPVMVKAACKLWQRKLLIFQLTAHKQWLVIPIFLRTGMPFGTSPDYLREVFLPSPKNSSKPVSPTFN